LAGLRSLADALLESIAGSRPVSDVPTLAQLLKLIDEQEVWAAGVTYLRSRAGAGIARQ